MTLYHKDKSTEIHNGDCLQVLRTLPDSSVDACVTDPPYGLAFMGKRWDYDVPSSEVWQECLRVLKPGGHLLAFAGTRTQHRMAVRIEDAGFEIRDMIAWVYGSGFSKGFNLSRVESCECGANPIPCTHTVKEGADGKTQTEHDMPGLRETNLSTTERVEEKRHPLLQSHMQQQAAGVQSNAQARSDCQAGKQNAGQEQSGMEGWGVHRAGQGLSNDPQSEASTGEAERLCAGTHTGGGTNAGQATAGRRGSSSHQPQQGGQQAGEPESVQQSPGALDAGALQGRGQCERCGKLKAQLKGWSSNLKPALEPITVARKPLTGTVAENVLQHGTGALNVDGCRIGEREKPRVTDPKHGGHAHNTFGKPSGGGNVLPPGRFPANLIHDGSDEVVGLFPESNGQQGQVTGKEPSSEINNVYGDFNGRPSTVPRGDTGSAARFFYCAKADTSERRQSKHPTIKPVALMRYLVRLVCPAGGVVLDPFAGSGTTIEAARLEHCRAIGIEREAEYCADILERLRQGVLF
jgi:DNA modification methylase